MAAFIAEGIQVFDPPRDIGVHELLISNNEVGHALAVKLGGKPAILLRGHGAVIVGVSLNVAVGRSIYLEESAKIQAEAIALGGDITYLDPQAALKRVDGDFGEHAWDVWKRKAMGSQPR
jgi:HCOMODA/2-hydroxy-3-carboxy-muconic semialdehyde decarboxylase